MQQQGVMTNVITYSALISACEKGNQPEQALGLLQEMVDQLLTPNVVSFSAFISTSEKEQAGEDVSFSASISGCEKGKQ